MLANSQILSQPVIRPLAIDSGITLFKTVIAAVCGLQQRFAKLCKGFCPGCNESSRGYDRCAPSICPIHTDEGVWVQLYPFLATVRAPACSLQPLFGRSQSPFKTPPTRLRRLSASAKESPRSASKHSEGVSRAGLVYHTAQYLAPENENEGGAGSKGGLYSSPYQHAKATARTRSSCGFSRHGPTSFP